MPHKFRKKFFKHSLSFFILLVSIGLITTGSIALWVATLKIPDLDSFQSRKTTESTKIYDRTGTILLFDTGKDSKRTAVTLADISIFIQQATIAIEDSNFYNNKGIEPSSIIRAFFANLTAGEYSQGASTITQQVVKNSLLTRDKTISRKIKEWVLAVKLSQILTKEQILEAYLNDTSYGGTIFGVEEASRQFFGKSAKDIGLAEASYLAAIPQAPTYYSPYGTNRKSLDSRRKLVLQRMKDLEIISPTEYETAIAEKVQFLAKNDSSIRAPHFVMYIRNYITEKYGEDMVDNGGLRVITTLDYDLQKTAEDVITKFSPTLEKNFNASNTAMVAIDPKTGDILTMVGSKDYFNEKIDGNFNIALAERQPGSTFKPFVYATAFKRGYTPETILFDVETQFSTECTVDGKTKNPNLDPKKICYTPAEYDNKFDGPITIRTALAHSRNIPAVKALYLAGIKNSLETSEDLGITSLKDQNLYGLTLVLGGGEVSLLEMTSAYGVFANDGIRNPYRSILRIEDTKGKVLETVGTILNSKQVLTPEISRQITSILSDPTARMDSLKPIAESIGRPVAIKTGTTNDFRDVWTIGYTPNLVVGAWAGKNDNTPMKQNVAGLIITPVWGAFMAQVAKNFPPESFIEPPTPLTDNKPVLRGIWKGGISYWKDSISGRLATEFTPPETRTEVLYNNVHSILYWLNKDDPLGPAPSDPTADGQFQNWEYGIRRWVESYKVINPSFQEFENVILPTELDNVHTPENSPKVNFISPINGSQIGKNDNLLIKLNVSGLYPLKKTELYLNGKYVLTSERDPLNISFFPSDVGGLNDTNTLSVTVYDIVFNKGIATTTFSSR